MSDILIDTIWGDPSGNNSIIKVIGVGGGGCNAVNHMYKLGIKDVGFVVCNTDAQALNDSSVPVKVQLGKKLTEGLGAGSEPEQGRLAAEESISEIREMMSNNTKMVFITAGMGGGTGTGAAPVVAKTAKDMGILTVAIVTVPFKSIEPERVEIAYEGIRALRNHVDSLIVVNNSKLQELYGNLKFSEAFAKADEVLCTAAKGIAEIITTSGHINVDFADVRTAMINSGVALMGTGRGTGEDRAIMAVDLAITSPLLNNNSIRGARKVLVNVMMGSNELTLEEVSSITRRVIEEAGSQIKVKTGIGYNSELGDDVTVSIIATGFEMSDIDIPGTAYVPPTIPIHTTKPVADPHNPVIEITTQPQGNGGVDDLFGAFTPTPASNINVEHNTLNTNGGARRVPKWLDSSISIDEKEKTRTQTQQANKPANGEMSLFTLNKKGNGLDNSTAAYINGKPD